MHVVLSSGVKGASLTMVFLSKDPVIGTNGFSVFPKRVNFFRRNVNGTL